LKGLFDAIRGRFDAVGYRVELLLQVITRLSSVWRRRVLISEQLYVGGIKVVHVVVLVGFSIGMVVSLQTGLELARIGQQDQIGTLVALSMAREMGPFITATVLAAAVGSALAAELGTMAVSEELAALEVLSIDRVSFLVMPRVVALATCAPRSRSCATRSASRGGFVARSRLGVGRSCTRHGHRVPAGSAPSACRRTSTRAVQVVLFGSRSR
jgi:phospholipid/cholesterol/gamma-HCH transport system permease protein